MWVLTWFLVHVDNSSRGLMKVLDDFMEHLSINFGWYRNDAAQRIFFVVLEEHGA